VSRGVGRLGRRKEDEARGAGGHGAEHRFKKRRMNIRRDNWGVIGIGGGDRVWKIFPVRIATTAC
jgi:hypothetical protein